MPSLAEHKTAAKRFYALYEEIPDDFPDGMALMLFYSALHWVEAVAASDGKHNRTHDKRRDFINTHHRKMWNSYRVLWELSEQARYIAYSGFTMDAKAVKHSVRAKSYRAIELWAASILGETPAEMLMPQGPSIKAPLSILRESKPSPVVTTVPTSTASPQQS